MYDMSNDDFHIHHYSPVPWQVCESGLNSFLQLAERLRVKGLCGMVGGGADSSRANQSDNTPPLYRSAVCVKFLPLLIHYFYRYY
jgi:hypothetical protein